MELFRFVEIMIGSEELIAMGLLTLLTTTTLLLLKKNRRPRRYAVRPINKKMKEMGMFNNILQDILKVDHESFFTYCRLTPSMFFNLLKMVEPHLRKDESKRPICPAQRLIITLHYLAEGCSMQELAWGHMIGHATVCVIIHETKVLWDVLAPIYLKAPSVEVWNDISKGFYRRWNFPNCIGAIDGKHISIQAP